ncbi:MAG: DUF1028 domain-containing protein [Gemmatimonadota bacterium]
MKRLSIALLLALPAMGAAQEEAGQDTARSAGDTTESVDATTQPIPAGVYTFVPDESEEIREKAREAVSHLFFAIRGIARGRLEGANEPIDRLNIGYMGDTLVISLRSDEPTVFSLMNGEFIPYTRADGETVQVKADVEPGMIDLFFQAEDGAKEMIFTLREDGKVALESITYSDRLREPFRYTWVYAPRGSGTTGDTGDDGASGLTGGGGGPPAATAAPGFAGRPVNTYSIVARDPDSGEIGVAVQSHWFSVGALVPWAEPGVGAVATQSFVDPSYGPLGLAMMRAGKTAEQALAALVEADAHPEVRQVAMVDADGNVAVHTGAGAIEAAGHVKGPGYSVQSNLMLRRTVPTAMARVYEAAEGDLTERLLAALEAAQAEGGDIRGRQSAAILVVAGEPVGGPWEGRVVDLRVEDHPEPVQELRRLVTLARAYDRMNAGDEALADGDVERALAEYAAAEAMVPDAATNGEMAFWHAVALATLGRVDESIPLFRRAFAQDGNWRTLLPRLVDAGQFPDDDELVERITALEPAGGS